MSGSFELPDPGISKVNSHNPVRMPVHLRDPVMHRTGYTGRWYIGGRNVVTRHYTTSASIRNVLRRIGGYIKIRAPSNGRRPVTRRRWSRSAVKVPGDTSPRFLFGRSLFPNALSPCLSRYFRDAAVSVIPSGITVALPVRRSSRFNIKLDTRCACVGTGNV